MKIEEFESRSPAGFEIIDCIVISGADFCQWPASEAEERRLRDFETEFRMDHPPLETFLNGVVDVSAVGGSEAAGYSEERPL